MNIKPELKEKCFNFGYGINYKYEGTLAHSFGRFYVVTKFILPLIGELKFSKLYYDNTCTYQFVSHEDGCHILTREKF